HRPRQAHGLSRLEVHVAAVRGDSRVEVERPGGVQRDRQAFGIRGAVENRGIDAEGCAALAARVHRDLQSLVAAYRSEIEVGAGQPGNVAGLGAGVAVQDIHFGRARELELRQNVRYVDVGTAAGSL